MKTVKYPAIQVKQGKKTVYTFKANGKHILDFASIARIKRNEDGVLVGYQRILVTKHVEEIASYLDTEEAMLTNSIVISFDDNVKFELIDEEHGFGYLVIPQGDDKCGQIVDGQQRTSALTLLKKDNFEVLVNAFITNDKNIQLEQFILVNNTKPLQKTLIHELLPLFTSDLPKQYKPKQLPMDIIEKLNLFSPVFKGKIKTQTNPDGIIAANTISSVLEASLKEGQLYYYTKTHTGNDEHDIESMITLINAYWGAVEEVFPVDWKLPPNKTRLTHGTGMRALGYLMEEFISRKEDQETYHSSDFIYELEKLGEKCNWNKGLWDFGGGVKRDILELQNVNKDITLLIEYLKSQI